MGFLKIHVMPYQLKWYYDMSRDLGLVEHSDFTVNNLTLKISVKKIVL